MSERPNDHVPEVLSTADADEARSEAGSEAGSELLSVSDQPTVESSPSTSPVPASHSSIISVFGKANELTDKTTYAAEKKRDRSAKQEISIPKNSKLDRSDSRNNTTRKSSLKAGSVEFGQETAPKLAGSKTRVADALMMRFRPKAAESSAPKKEGSKSSKADGRNLRFRILGQTQTSKATKTDKKKRRHKAPRVKTSPNDPVFYNPPKPGGETNTSSTHDGHDQDDRSSSSDFSLSKGDRDSSDNDQECDSSSSSNSVSNTQKTQGGDGFEHSKGDKVINASRYIFFAILGISACVIAGLAYYFFKRNETDQFKKEFEAQVEEVKLYTQHNIDTVFETIKGLSTFTTSLVKQQSAETDWPPGFIMVPDVLHNMGLARNVSKALVLAYMPKVLNGDYDRWIDFSVANKNWIADQQPDGPVDAEPIIREYIWEYTDYKFEETNVNGSYYDLELKQDPPGKQRNLSNTDPGLRGFAHKQHQGRQLEPPVDCSGAQDRRRRQLANKHDNGRLLDQVATDDNRFFGADKHDEDSSDSKRSDDDDLSVDEDVDQSVIDQAPYEDEYQTPVWQISPIPTFPSSNPDPYDVQVINYNLADRVRFFTAVEYMENSRDPVFLDVIDQSAWFLINENKDVLQTVVAFPVFEDFSNNSAIVGFYAAIIPWKEFFVNTLGKETKDMVVVMNNTCGELFSVNVTADRGAEIIVTSDVHDTAYDDMVTAYPFGQEYSQDDFADFQEEICLYFITVYPTKTFEESSRSNRPLIVSVAIILVFLFTSFAFMMFDCLVTKRQNRLLNTAMRQNAIVNSLFPKNITRKLMAEANATTDDKNRNVKRRNLTTFLNDDQRGQERKSGTFDSKPIADLFPFTTIMFADISGFTAWSSAREPEAVFTLLETIYQAFDEIAKRRRVFKVEVVGDCYVAVCGLPDPRKDHYAVMCRFAQDCMAAMHVHTKELEIRLGPDTGDLALRVGLHSGPVVAGVLRGDKSRFQLFGDTLNTASRMESTGVQNRIQLSQATADLLILNGKEHWITKRVDKVRAKGKGEMTTYFLLSVKKKSSSTTSASASKIDEVILVRSGNHSKGVKTVEKRNRVADWVVEMLGKLLKEMKAKRKLTGIRRDNKATIQELENRSIGAGSSGEHEDRTVIDEVAEYLKLPSFFKGGPGKENPHVTLDKEIIDELQHYVYSIASLYKKNPFHNFEHASHVSMSCIKLLNRIASHDEENLDSSNHHTYGICSDPLTSFAIVFSALIHDVDHCGVPNAQLVKENAEVATIYKNKSVAEQNSIDIGWGLLMEPTYSNLRRHIYTTVAEYKCFRQIVVNCIMATDICDKDLIKARNKRWDLAFSSDLSLRSDDDHGRRTSYRKATVVIEHLIQLSDVSHTMQHWHMYRRWNERLFEEGYKAYIEGRAEKDPTENWYKGELGFYDFYIIPLAKKIKQCAVFGVSSDEYLSYAVANRAEWEERGNEVVKDMVNKVHALYHTGASDQVKDLERPSSPTLGNALSSNPNLKDLDTKVDDAAASESVHAEEPTSRSSGSGYSDGYGNDDDEDMTDDQPDDLEAEVGASDAGPTSESESSFNI